MSDTPFYRTVMGQRFYEGTAPALVRELARLNANLERLLTQLEPPVPPDRATDTPREAER